MCKKYPFWVLILALRAVWSDSQISLHHKEGPGVGYTTGYTTLEAFYQSSNDSFSPMVDLRGHLFDNGELAANIGIGLRARRERLFGLYSYCDWRGSPHYHYKQFTIGLESLGDFFDVRLNGYLPFGKKESPYFHKRDFFADNHLYTSKKREVALKGINAEIGAPLLYADKHYLYGALGPYYLNGKGERGWGIAGRLLSLFHKVVEIEVTGSYDPLFKWRGEVSIGLALQRGREKGCCHSRVKYSPPSRREIIAIDEQKQKKLVINPATGKPYTFLFINNLSRHSFGTFENPFSNLSVAETLSNPHDIFYVYPGDGTSKGLDRGIRLKHFQSLWGSGTAHTLATPAGLLTIAPQTRKAPSLVHVDHEIVQLSDNNQVDGLHFGSCSRAIIGNGIKGATLSHNHFDSSSNKIIDLRNVSGQITINNNEFINLRLNDYCSGIDISNQTNSHIVIDSNLFKNQTGNGISILSTGNAAQTIEIVKNSLFAPIGYKSLEGFGYLRGANGICVKTEDESLGTITLVDNHCYHHETFGIVLVASEQSQLNSQIVRNIIEPGVVVPFRAGHPSIGIFVETHDAAAQQTLIAKNRIGPAKSFGICFATHSGRETTVNIYDNTVLGGGQAYAKTHMCGGIATILGGVGRLTANVERNTLSECQGQGGFFAMNTSTEHLPTGTLFLKLLDNNNDSIYTLYNENYTRHGMIIVSPGSESNRGIIVTTPMAPDIPDNFKVPGPVIFLE